MDNGLSAEHEELGATVRRFLTANSSEHSVRDMMGTELGLDPRLWRQMAGQLGLHGLIIPEEYGGSGHSFVELAVVLEEMGRALLCAPFFSTVVLAASALLESGDESARARWLPGIAAGETLATVALGEPIGAENGSGIRVSASAVGGSWQLDGHASFVLDGMAAELILVVAGTSQGTALFAVDSRAPGLSRTALTTMDQTRKQADLAFHHVPAVLVGEDGQGERIAARTLELAAVALAAEHVGGAARCLEMAADYASSRMQFGRPIGSFQAIKHKCADMLLSIESARSAAYHAAWCAAERDAGLPLMASLAKAYCSDAYVHAAAENIQIHGGIGFTWEHPAHLYLKRAKSGQLLFGGSVMHRERVAELVGL